MPFDIEDRKSAHWVLLSLVETVSARLRQDNYCAFIILPIAPMKFGKSPVPCSINCGRVNPYGTWE